MAFLEKIHAQDTKLLLGFTLLIVFIILIGAAGIWKIDSLSQTIEELGKRNLAIEKSLLDIQINNTLYVLGVRNYALWQTSKYLGALSIAANLEALEKTAADLNQQLAICEKYIRDPQQKTWLKQLSVSINELRGLGNQIIDMAKSGAASPELNNLLVIFENRFYKINEFLNDTLAKSNLQEIDQRIQEGYARRQQAILLLSWVLILSVIVGSGTARWVYWRRKLERERREEMVRHIITVEERERQNLSAQIHDQMAQDLSALKIYTGVIEQGVRQDESTAEFREKIGQMKGILSGLMEKTHNICLLLRPPSLDELGLLASIEALILEYKRLTGINYVYQKPSVEPQLSPEVSLFLYRLTQEALTNSAKYARAKNASIKLELKEKKIEFIFQDDGTGFDYQQVINQPRRRQEDKLKLGLVGLKERVELLGGTMRIDSSSGTGTRINVRLNI